MFKFIPTSRFKWVDPKEFDLNKHTSNSLEGCVLQVDLEYLQELRELHSDDPLAPDKIETKREMLSDYLLQFADLYSIPNCIVKKLASTFFDKEKYVIHSENLNFAYD